MPCLQTLAQWLEPRAQYTPCISLQWYPEYHTQELHPMASLYHWKDENVATPLINSFLNIAGSVTKLKQGCFGPRSNEYLLIRKRSLVLVATIQLSLSARASYRALELYAPARATSTDIICHMTSPWQHYMSMRII